MSQEYGMFWGPELLNCEDTKASLVEGFLYENDCMCISSNAGIGKSIFMLQLIGSLTSGMPFLNTFKISKPVNVLYVQTEGDRSETINRINLMRDRIMFDNTKWAHLNMGAMILNTVDGIIDFKSWLDTCPMEFQVIIFDPLYTTVKGSMSSDDVATDWIRNVRTIRERYNRCAIIVVHHEGKEQYHQGKLLPKSDASVFGSTFWQAFFNQNFKFTRYGNTLTLKGGKDRGNKIIDDIQLSLMGPKPLYFAVKDPLDASTSTGKCAAILEEAHDWISFHDIKTQLGTSRATVYRALASMKEKKRIRTMEDNGIVYYRFVQESEIDHEYEEEDLTYA